MAKIEQVDKNLAVETKIDRADVRFYDTFEAPFKIYGLMYEDGMFKRLPGAVAKGVSNGVYELHAHTAGGRVRFKTDSPYVAIHSVTGGGYKMPHFTLVGSMGFDLYADNTYVRSFVPPIDIEEDYEYEGVIDIPMEGNREITINFPLYGGVKKLYVGVAEGSKLEAPDDYKDEKPIVYYGSSITQGGCASRPGTAYESIISRRLGYDHVNLGFSGSAKAEDEIVDYIKGLDMKVLVMDYDCNAPDAEHLKNTHEKMFLSIRKEKPELPIVLMSMPKNYVDNDVLERRAIIKNTYDNARAAGDENVYFIPGTDLMKYTDGEGTVDSIHPTDHGFFSMAKVLGEVLEKILG